jgi:hypothetical protein
VHRDVARGKPEPDLFLAALRRWDGVDAANALVFEDSPLGIAAANRAGMPAVFVPDSHVDPVKSLREYGATAVLTLASLELFDFDRFDWQPSQAGRREGECRQSAGICCGALRWQMGCPAFSVPGSARGSTITRGGDPHGARSMEIRSHLLED